MAIKTPIVLGFNSSECYHLMPVLCM